MAVANTSSGPTDPSFSGGCLCGRIRFSYVGPVGGELGATTVCHCMQCRRVQGFASAVAPILAANYQLERGDDLVCEFESSAGKFRAFCTACGSPLYSRRTAAPEVLRLRLGSLDGSPELRIDAHIHTAGAPSWAWPSEAPAFEGVEPGLR